LQEQSTWDSDSAGCFQRELIYVPFLSAL